MKPPEYSIKWYIVAGFYPPSPRFRSFGDNPTKFRFPTTNNQSAQAQVISVRSKQLPVVLPCPEMQLLIKVYNIIYQCLTAHCIFRCVSMFLELEVFIYSFFLSAPSFGPPFALSFFFVFLSLCFFHFHYYFSFYCLLYTVYSFLYVYLFCCSLFQCI